MKHCKVQGLTRLQELADHLLKGERIHENFDYTRWNNFYPQRDKHYKGRVIYHCGTEGCAAGELPALSEDWSFNPSGFLSYKGSEAVESSLMNYFCLSYDEMKYLFYPDEDKKQDKWTGDLGAVLVARKIINFIREDLPKYGLTCRDISNLNIKKAEAVV